MHERIPTLDCHRLFACSLAVAGAVGVAFAQSTTPSTPSSTVPYPDQNQGQGSGQMQGQTPSTSATRSTDDTLRSDADRAAMGTERAARADRN